MPGRVPPELGIRKRVKGFARLSQPRRLQLSYSYYQRSPSQGDFTITMTFMSLLLAVISLNPAFAPRPAVGFTQGYIEAQPLANTACKPGAICASFKFNRNGCFFNNFWQKGVKGGTPLAIDVTQTGSNGSPVYVYWINNTNTNIVITGKANAKFFCPPISG